MTFPTLILHDDPSSSSRPTSISHPPCSSPSRTTDVLYDQERLQLAGPNIIFVNSARSLTYRYQYQVVTFCIYFFTFLSTNHLCYTFIQAISFYPHFRSLFVSSVIARRCLMYLRGEPMTSCCCQTQRHQPTYTSHIARICFPASNQTYLVMYCTSPRYKKIRSVERRQAHTPVLLTSYAVLICTSLHGVTSLKT